MLHTLLIVQNTGTNPYKNLALEQALCEHAAPSAFFLYLWRNSHTVVIGKNQNAWAECDLTAMGESSVLLARRMTGGGAVYHDLDNLNFSLICPPEHYDVGRNFTMLRDALGALGVDAQLSGRNDLTVDGKKCSGNAFYRSATACMHHGTLLLRVDSDAMARYLRPSAKKLQAHGVASTRSRVVGLAEHCPGLTIHALSGALISTCAAQLGLEPQPYEPAGELLRTAERLYAQQSSTEWQLGAKMDGPPLVSERFAWGEVQVFITAEGGRVKHANIFTDALHTACFESLARALRGVPYTPAAMAAAAGELAEQLAEQERGIIGDISALFKQLEEAKHE